MAPDGWSCLHNDILSEITKILNTDVDRLVLRSVCSSWRSGIRPPRLNPSSFPLKVPPLWNHGSMCRRGRYEINYTTLYRLSRPEQGPQAGDPHDGWLFRVSAVNPNRQVYPNRFTLLSPMGDKVDVPSATTIPRHVNLLEYRITGVYRCYTLQFIAPNGCQTDVLKPIISMVSVPSEWEKFSVLVLFSDGTVSCWSFGQKQWSPFDTKSMGYRIVHMAACKEYCYGITKKGVLVSFDSHFTLTVVRMPPLRMTKDLLIRNYLLEYESRLYSVQRVLSRGVDDDGIYIWSCIFENINGGWLWISDWKDASILHFDDALFGISPNDLKSCRPSSIYLAFKSDNLVRHCTLDLAVRQLIAPDVTACAFLLWPPPQWLISDKHE